MIEEVKLLIPEGQKYLIGAEYENGKKVFKENGGDQIGLPSGIINKRFTGIGATTLELESQRHSIIVFPYKNLAEEKASKSDKYFLFPRDAYQAKEALFNYLNNKVEFKKILILVDRIRLLAPMLKDFPEFEFHIILDEIDILQSQSKFRNRIPPAFEFAMEQKEFTLISATPLEFSHPKLSSVPYYGVHKEYHRRGALKIVSSNTPLNDLVWEVMNLLGAFEDRKILIGLNSVSAIKTVIEGLEEHGFDEISVLASETTLRDQIPNKYHGEVQNGKLPQRVNFCTIRYYSGIDIYENIESIAVSLDTEVHHTFSFENFIQFFGRDRLLLNESYTIIVKEDFSFGKLNEILETEISTQQDLEEFPDVLNEHFKNSIQNRNELSKGIVDSKFNKVNNFYFQKLDGGLSFNSFRIDLNRYLLQILEDYQNDKFNLFCKFQEYFEIVEHYQSFEENEEKLSYQKLSLEELVDNLLDSFDEPHKIRWSLSNIPIWNNHQALKAIFLLERGRAKDREDLKSILLEHISNHNRLQITFRRYVDFIQTVISSSSKTKKDIASSIQLKLTPRQKLNVADHIRESIKLHFSISDDKECLALAKMLINIEERSSKGRKYFVNGEVSNLSKRYSLASKDRSLNESFITKGYSYNQGKTYFLEVIDKFRNLERGKA